MATKSTEERNRNESQGKQLAASLVKYIEKHGGAYLRDERGLPCVILHGKRIPINFDRDNYALSHLMLTACNVSTLSPAAQVAIQRLQVHAAQIAGKVRFRKFSAMSDDGKRLYVPCANGTLLRITAENLSTGIANGTNEDSIWLEHPEVKDSQPL